MKTTKVIYWTSTILVSLMMAFSAYAYFTNPEVNAGFLHLGFSSNFRVQLGIAKILGVVGLLIPGLTGGVSVIKEWVYAGFTFTFIAAFLAHTTSGDPAKVALFPLVMLAVLAVSYISYKKLQKGQTRVAI
ncbi:MAG: DoxX family protein [Chitinophagaceae bacterium]